MLDHTWVISPTVVFDHHFSWAHMESHRASVDPLGTAPFGIPASATPGLTATFTPQVEATTGQLGQLGNSEPFEAKPQLGLPICRLCFVGQGYSHDKIRHRPETLPRPAL